MGALRRIAPLLAVWLAANAGAAEAEQMAAVIECGKIESDRERIACYDRIARAQSDPADPAEAAHEPRPQAAEMRDDRSAEQATNKPTSPVPAPLAVSAGSAASAAPAASASPPEGQAAVDAFGADKLSHRNRGGLDRIVAGITGVRKLSRGNFQLTLDNGQKWREIEYDKYARYSVGDTIEIRRGRVGTYDLVSRTTGHRNKVRRIR